jgi:hypothetical protein
MHKANPCIVSFDAIKRAKADREGRPVGEFHIFRDVWGMPL